MKKDFVIFYFLSPALLCLLAVASGCVSKSAYEANMANIYKTLQNERTVNAQAIKALENKLQERGKSLTELTNRYIILEMEKDQSQHRLSSLRNDMESLLRDLEELRFVTNANLKGAAANEMNFKIADMQRRIQVILGKEALINAPQ